VTFLIACFLESSLVMVCLGHYCFFSAQDTCYPYLYSEKTNYLGDTEWFDDPGEIWGSMVTEFIAIFKIVMKSGLCVHTIFMCPCFISRVSYPLTFLCGELACLANVKELICHAAFKECADIDGSFLPAFSWYRAYRTSACVEFYCLYL
jgi:hypothetical protein